MCTCVTHSGDWAVTDYYPYMHPDAEHLPDAVPMHIMYNVVKARRHARGPRAGYKLARATSDIMLKLSAVGPASVRVTRGTLMMVSEKDWAWTPSWTKTYSVFLVGDPDLSVKRIPTVPKSWKYFD